MGQGFGANVVGVTKKNNDGSSRQKILKKSRNQKTAELYRDSLNLHDRNAFAVFTTHGQIGYVPSEIAAHMAPNVDKGKTRYVITRLQIREWEKDGRPIWVAKISIESRSMKTGKQIYLKDLPITTRKTQKFGRGVGYGTRMVLGATKLGCLLVFFGFMFLCVIAAFLSWSTGSSVVDHSSYPPANNKTNSTNSTNNTNNTIDVIEYINEAKPIPGIKRMLDVHLKRKVSKEQLRDIALKLKADDSGTYERTFIGYYLPGMKVNSGYWATSHFTPELEVKILGFNVEEEKSLRMIPESQPPGLLGYWFSDDVDLGKRFSIYKKGNTYFMESMYPDGSSGPDRLVEKPYKGGRKFMRFKYSDPDNDYYVIDPNSNLQIWSVDLDGTHVLVHTAEKIN